MALRAGAIRFNTDSSQMEIYDGNQWTGILATSPDLQTGGTRGILMGGGAPSPSYNTDKIQYITIQSTGNAVDFGNMEQNTTYNACSSNSVRGISGGNGASPSNKIDFITPVWESNNIIIPLLDGIPSFGLSKNPEATLIA